MTDARRRWRDRNHAVAGRPARDGADRDRAGVRRRRPRRRIAVPGVRARRARRARRFVPGMTLTPARRRRRRRKAASPGASRSTTSPGSPRRSISPPAQAAAVDSICEPRVRGGERGAGGDLAADAGRPRRHASPHRRHPHARRSARGITTCSPARRRVGSASRQSTTAVPRLRGLPGIAPPPGPRPAGGRDAAARGRRGAPPPPILSRCGGLSELCGMCRHRMTRGTRTAAWARLRASRVSALVCQLLALVAARSLRWSLRCRARRVPSAPSRARTPSRPRSRAGRASPSRGRIPPRHARS